MKRNPLFLIFMGDVIRERETSFFLILIGDVIFRSKYLHLVKILTYLIMDSVKNLIGWLWVLPLDF